MTANLILLAFSVILLMTYLFVIYKKYGRMKTISDSYYKIPKKLRWIFTLVWWGFSIPLMIVGSTGLMFLAGAGICFVGTAPAFREDLEGKVHVVGAITGIIAGTAALWFDYGYWYLSLLMALVAGVLTLCKKVWNPTWWIEFSAFVIITSGLLMNILK